MAQSIIQPQLEAPVAPVDMDALASLYHIDDSEGIHRYLLAHPLAAPLLLAAPTHIAHIFGPHTPVRLLIEQDPEWLGRQYLWVDIMVLMPTEADEIAADNLLHRLHDDWLIHLPRIETMDVHFSVEAAQ